MSTPKIHLVAYASRTPKFIFVAIPNEIGRYLRTDLCVALEGCPLCASIAGEPCKNQKSGRYHGGTHYVRRRLTKNKAKALIDVIAPVKKEKS